jgi:hypothetical protein
MILTDGRPNPASGAGTKLEAYESLDDIDRAFVDELAMEVAYLVGNNLIDLAKAKIKHDLDGAEDMNTWLLALYWKLDSKTRSALKK